MFLASHSEAFSWRKAAVSQLQDSRDTPRRHQSDISVGLSIRSRKAKVDQVHIDFSQ